MSDLKSLASSDDPEEALAAVVALRLMADRLEREQALRAQYRYPRIP